MISELGTRVLRLSVEADMAIGTESFRDWQMEVSVPTLLNERCSGMLSLALPIGLDFSFTSKFLD